MNLVNFHKVEKNRKFIAENICYHSCQGLIDTYSILLFGNGFNEYQITLNDDKSTYTLYLEECCVNEWTVGTKCEDQKEPHEVLTIDAWGRLDNYGYHNIETHHFDFDHLWIHGKKFKVVDINIKNDRMDKLITNICDDYVFIQHREDKEKYFNEIFDFNRMKTYANLEIQKVELKSWLQKYEKNKTYYFITDMNLFVYPFKVREIKDGRMNCDIGYNKWTYSTNVDFEYIGNLECLDDYDIRIKFKINTELFGVIETVDDYCYIGIISS